MEQPLKPVKVNRLNQKEWQPSERAAQTTDKWNGSVEEEAEKTGAGDWTMKSDHRERER